MHDAIRNQWIKTFAGLIKCKIHGLSKFASLELINRQVIARKRRKFYVHGVCG